ncbi:MAG TPA: hypothetical protein VIO94_11720 [Phenylobacterium sp.]
MYNQEVDCDPEERLPPDLLQAACLSSGEWAWSPELIPRLIAEAEKLGLLNVGGQLKFVLPGEVCECWWVSVDPLEDEPTGLSWDERVSRAASRALQGFAQLCADYDFEVEGRRTFGQQLGAYAASGGELSKVTFFVWYLEAEEV